MKTAPDTDSGIDRGQGTDSRISQHSAVSSSAAAAARENPKLWASFKRHVRRFGGSTGSLSSPSPTSEAEHPAPAPTAMGKAGHHHPAPSSQPPPARSQSGSSLYSPEVAQLDSPREGGFQQHPSAVNGGDGLPQSTALLKRHVKELYAQISKAEADKQKISDQAYRRAM